LKIDVKSSGKNEDIALFQFNEMITPVDDVKEFTETSGRRG